MKKNLTNETRKILGVITSLFSLLIIGCEDNPEYYDDVDFNYALAIPQDSNGYYHMDLRENWQTTQRLTGTLTSNHSETREDYQRERDIDVVEFKVTTKVIFSCIFISN